MNELGAWLYEASNALLVPVVVSLLALTVIVLVAFGRFLREALERRGGVARWAEFGAELRAAGPGCEALGRGFFDRAHWPGLLARFARIGAAVRDQRVHLDALVTECELEAGRRVARMSLIARIGPTLGLMGTLIPMGPALVALAGGDVGGLAKSLVVAFTTTVVGLAVGLCGMAMATVRRHWYAADLAAIETVIDVLGERREQVAA